MAGAIFADQWQGQVGTADRDFQEASRKKIEGYSNTESDEATLESRGNLVKV